jgi:hypothetical protein
MNTSSPLTKTAVTIALSCCGIQALDISSLNSEGSFRVKHTGIISFSFEKDINKIKQRHSIEDCTITVKDALEISKRTILDNLGKEELGKLECTNAELISLSGKALYWITKWNYTTQSGRTVDQPLSVYIWEDGEVYPIIQAPRNGGL